MIFSLEFLIEIFIVSLAVWRLSYMLVNEAMPFYLGIRIRNLLGIKVLKYEDEERKHYLSNQELISFYKTGNFTNLEFIALNWLAELLGCVLCTSVWVGFFAYVLRNISFNIYFAIAFILTTSAIAIFTNKASQK